MNINDALLRNAAGYLGITEVAGRHSDPTILAMIRELFPTANDDSTVPWCSVFMNVVARNECAENPIDLGHKFPGMARSWLDVGEIIETPRPGDVVILWRGSPSSPKGHVGLYCNTVKNKVIMLGGNQGDAVTVSAYDLNRVIGYRRLRPF